MKFFSIPFLYGGEANFVVEVTLTSVLKSLLNFITTSLDTFKNCTHRSSRLLKWLQGVVIHMNMGRLELLQWQISPYYSCSLLFSLMQQKSINRKAASFNISLHIDRTNVIDSHQSKPSICCNELLMLKSYLRDIIYAMVAAIGLLSVLSYSIVTSMAVSTPVLSLTIFIDHIEICHTLIESASLKGVFALNKMNSKGYYMVLNCTIPAMKLDTPFVEMEGNFIKLYHTLDYSAIKLYLYQRLMGTSQATRTVPLSTLNVKHEKLSIRLKDNAINQCPAALYIFLKDFNSSAQYESFSYTGKSTELSSEFAPFKAVSAGLLKMYFTPVSLIADLFLKSIALVKYQLSSLQFSIFDRSAFSVQDLSVVKNNQLLHRDMILSNYNICIETMDFKLLDPSEESRFICFDKLVVHIDIESPHDTRKMALYISSTMRCGNGNYCL